MTTEYFFMPDVKVPARHVVGARLDGIGVVIALVGHDDLAYTGEDAALSILALQNCGFLTKPQAAAMQQRFYRLNRGAK